MITDYREKVNGSIPGCRIFRPRDAQWWYPPRQEWGNVVPYELIPYKEMSFKFDNGNNAYYASGCWLALPTPTEAWGVNEDVYVYVHLVPDGQPIDIMVCRVNEFIRADTSGTYPVYDHSKGQWVYHTVSPLGAEQIKD